MYVIMTLFYTPQVQIACPDYYILCTHIPLGDDLMDGKSLMKYLHM